MRSPIALFLIRVSAVAGALASFLLVDAFLTDALSFWGLLGLLPMAALVTFGLLGLSLRPARKPARRRPAPVRRPAAGAVVQVAHPRHVA